MGPCYVSAVRVIALSTLKRFFKEERHADAREPTLAWYRQVVAADWATPVQVKRDLRTASILRDGRVVFNTMDVRPIRTKADHRRALKEIEGLMSARRGTPEGDLLDVLTTLVEAYEAKRVSRGSITSSMRPQPATFITSMSLPDHLGWRFSRKARRVLGFGLFASSSRAREAPEGEGERAESPSPGRMVCFGPNEERAAQRGA
jgi:hypothetical protein